MEARSTRGGWVVTTPKGGPPGVELGQPELAAAGDRVGPAAHVERAEGAPHVALDRVQGDVELAADLALGELAPEQAQDRQLALAQLEVDRQQRLGPAPSPQLQRALGFRQEVSKETRIRTRVEHVAGLA